MNSFKRTLILFILFSFTNLYLNASQFRISGFVKDKQSNETLIGANIRIENQKTGTTTDNNGYFSLKVDAPCDLLFTYVGYRAQQFSINITNDTLLVVHLVPENNLKELVVSAKAQSTPGVTRISAAELQLIPIIGGKPDVLKAIQLLPGVLSQSEGMSLILVRGGEPGQNLYLLDNVPLTYVNHLGGFTSVFNPDMINSVDLYKSNFPARQGGKLSSIVDITQREGDVSKPKGSFSIGIIDATLTLEGPLANKKMSYLITARKTLYDAVMAATSYFSSGNDGVLTYGFHDINAKLTWKPDNVNIFSFNFYQGSDYINIWSKETEKNPNEKNHTLQAWGNVMAAGRWKRVFGSKLHAENILSASRYNNGWKQRYSYKENDSILNDKVAYRTSVTDISMRSNWKYELLRNWNVEFGGLASSLSYEPSYFYSSYDTENKPREIFRSFESALYLENKIQLFSRLLFQPSIRFVHYVNDGNKFNAWEPRLSLGYKISNSQNLSVNYQRITQNSHLVFAQGAFFKQEIWLPASKNIVPQAGRQLSLSWNSSYFDAKYSTEINAYYKKMSNLATLKEGYENMVGMEGTENKMETNGEGLAYGTEFTLRKNTGKWTGSLGYAWSVANRRYEHINSGNTYEFDYNRPHNIILNISRQLKNNWTFNAVWVYQTGQPYTPALGKIFTIDLTNSKLSTELIYGEKNSDRMVDYHRLDLGLNHTIKTRKGNKAVWTYSLYNAYNHINPYNYYYENDNHDQNGVDFAKPLKLYKISLFNFIPSISYKYFF